MKLPLALTLCLALAACARVAPTSTDAKPSSAAAWGAARRFANLKFGQIAYVDRGAGEVALFLHGAPLNGY